MLLAEFPTRLAADPLLDDLWLSCGTTAQTSVRHGVSHRASKSEGTTEKTELPQVATDRLVLHARWDRVGSDCGSVGCPVRSEEGCHPPRERRAIGCQRGSSN